MKSSPVVLPPPAKASTVSVSDQMAFTRMMMETFLGDEQQIKLFGRKIEPIPDFRLEMMNQGGGFPKFLRNNSRVRLIEIGLILEAKNAQTSEEDF